MHQTLKNTLIGLTIIAAMILGSGLLLFNTVFVSYYFGFFPYLVLFFLIVNAAFFFFFFKSIKKSDTQFIRIFMGAAGIKILLYFLIVLIYILAKPQYAIPFSITLLLLYFIFTAYDLFVMLKLMKRKKENKSFPNHMSN